MISDFDQLVQAVRNLSIEDKLRLWDEIDNQIAEYREQHPKFRAEVEQALKAFEDGDYVTIEELIA